MIMESVKNNVTSNAGNKRAFTIAGTENIFQTLSSRLYKKPICAIIRETVSNAIDANIEAGVDEQITLHLPSSIEPEFYVEDHGIGMNEETIYNVYTQYGNSTKSGSDDFIGVLGLGSKTPFSYTSQFTVISSKDGIKNTFVAYLDEEGIPSISKVGSEPCDQNGTKVSFPVKISDIADFYSDAASTLLFSMKMPKLVGDADHFWYVADVKDEAEFVELRNIIKENYGLSKKDEKVDKIYRIMNRSSYSSIIVEMGGVAYSVSTSELLDGKASTWNGLIGYFFDNYRMLVLHFGIDSGISIQSSREELQYTEKTKNILNKRIVSLFVAEATKEVESIVNVA